MSEGIKDSFRACSSLTRIVHEYDTNLSLDLFIPINRLHKLSRSFPVTGSGMTFFCHPTCHRQFYYGSVEMADSESLLYFHGILRG